MAVYNEVFYGIEQIYLRNNLKFALEDLPILFTDLQEIKKVLCFLTFKNKDMARENIEYSYYTITKEELKNKIEEENKNIKFNIAKKKYVLYKNADSFIKKHKKEKSLNF